MLSIITLRSACVERGMMLNFQSKNSIFLMYRSIKKPLMPHKQSLYLSTSLQKVSKRPKVASCIIVTYWES